MNAKPKDVGEFEPKLHTNADNKYARRSVPKNWSKNVSPFTTGKKSQLLIEFESKSVSEFKKEFQRNTHTKNVGGLKSEFPIGYVNAITIGI